MQSFASKYVLTTLPNVFFDLVIYNVFFSGNVSHIYFFTLSVHIKVILYRLLNYYFVVFTFQLSENGLAVENFSMAWLIIHVNLQLNFFLYSKMTTLSECKI